LSNNIGQFLDSNVWKFGEYKQLIYIGPDQELTLTNRQIMDNARSLATGLRARGCRKGERIASVLSNIPQLPEIINGVHRMGGVYMPVIFMLTAEEIHYILADSGCRLIVTEDKLLPRILEAVEGLEPEPIVINIGTEKGKNIVPYEHMLGASDERGNVVNVDNDDMAILMYTSGTTGYPKGVMLTHMNMYSQMRSGVAVWGTDKGESLLTTIPMNNIYGVISCLEGYLTGFTNILMPPFDPRKVLDTVRRFRVSILPIVPAMLNFLLLVWDADVDDLSSLNMIVCSGAPLPEDVLEKAKHTFKVNVVQGYGCTEVGGSISRQRLDWPLKPGSAGFPIPGISVRIVDDDGQEVKRGDEGEILCKGPMVTRGYFNKPRDSAATFKQGWFHTGDIGKLDDDGELYVTGRKKDIIIKGGQNIDPVVAENRLYQHPSVLECAVIAISDDKYGEEVAAAIVLKPGCQASEDELLLFASQGLHHFLTPKRVFFMQSLPRTGIGKIRKNDLRDIVDRLR
jgi:acyl-CoA synthetase (AMP-forming)/AMP-acid ligase II